tara:strand:+ start:3578 stop:4012 length:435 start_codon:yes stop_codon:yes gene_type:complete
MQKIIYTDKIPDNCATKGLHPNLFPDGWREIDVEEFAQSEFFTYSPTHVEYRQMYDSNTDGVPSFRSSPMVAARLFHFHDGTGIAMSNEWWDKKVRYFKFGCDHKYNELSQKESRDRSISHFGMCYHVYECEKCNYIMSQDSSG